MPHAVPSEAKPVGAQFDMAMENPSRGMVDARAGARSEGLNDPLCENAIGTAGKPQKPRQVINVYSDPLAELIRRESI